MIEQAHALGQKYMGLRSSMSQYKLQDTSFQPSSGHDVLVDNFLNAQCKNFQVPHTPSFSLAQAKMLTS